MGVQQTTAWSKLGNPSILLATLSLPPGVHIDLRVSFYYAGWYLSYGGNILVAGSRAELRLNLEADYRTPLAEGFRLPPYAGPVDSDATAPYPRPPGTSRPSD